VIVHEGRVLASGPPGEIVADPRVREVYLGERVVLSGGGGSEGPPPRLAEGGR